MSLAIPSTGFRLSTISQVAVPVHDIARAIRFYREKLGLAFLFEAPGLAFFQCGDIMLMLSLPSSAQFDHPSSVLYFQVDDIDTAYQALLARGVGFVDQPHLVHRAADYELWMSFFRDPDDNTMAIRAVRKILP
jgi:catechol 2,3-dioxygenase-like lactoylglutathione lyase family enzyme